MSIDIDNIEVEGINNNIMYNHGSRRRAVNNLLKSRKIVEVDHLGKERVTNEYKKTKKKEKNNFKDWFSRIKRSSEYGKKVEYLNKERDYQNRISYMEEKDALFLQGLVEKYGEEDGMKEYDNFWKNKLEKDQKK